MQTNRMKVIPILLILGMIGCDEKEDSRLVEMAERHEVRQAEQNRQMADLQREIAEGSRRLVEADAAARREMVVVHQEIQAERGELNHQLTALEEERRDIATQRRTESMLVPIAKVVALACFAMVVVGFCWTLLFGLQRQEINDAQVVELLLTDIVSEKPALLPPAPTPLTIRDAKASPTTNPTNQT